MPVDRGKYYVAPSGVQKERIKPEDLFVLDSDSNVLETPAQKTLKPSECTPLFMNAFTLRDAGACLHSHSQNAVIATMLCDKEFRITNIEMIKVHALCSDHCRSICSILACSQPHAGHPQRNDRHQLWVCSPSSSFSCRDMLLFLLTLTTAALPSHPHCYTASTTRLSFRSLRTQRENTSSQSVPA